VYDRAPTPARAPPSTIRYYVSRFWDPRMKQRLFELADWETTDFGPVAVAATALLPIGD
jgi:hypothetical protein